MLWVSESTSETASVSQEWIAKLIDKHRDNIVYFGERGTEVAVQRGRGTERHIGSQGDETRDVSWMFDSVYGLNSFIILETLT